MNKVLVTGGSHAELPLIEALHHLGYYVITTGNDETGLGHQKSDAYCKGDYSDREFVLQLAKKEQVCGIVSGCNDFAYISTAYACEQLGLPGHDTLENALMIHQKNRFRTLLKQINLPCPKYRYCYSVEEVQHYSQEIGFPLLMKPIDLTGGKGVCVCNDRRELVQAYEVAMRYTRQNGVLMEEYIVGTNHGVSLLVQDNAVQFMFLDNEQYYLNPYLVAGACTAYNVEESIATRIRDNVELLFSKSKLENGLFHCQLIITDSGIPYMIDPCRRAPGDLYIKLVEYVTGIPYPEAIVKSELGLDLSNDLTRIQHNLIARECIMTNQNGVLKRVEISEDYKKYIFDSIIWGRQGDKISDYLKYKAGILFLKFSSESEMKEKLLTLYDNVKIVLVGKEDDTL